MAEVGLVALARVALQISKASIPAQRTKFSKKVFSQPQLLALLCCPDSDFSSHLIC